MAHKEQNDWPQEQRFKNTNKPNPQTKPNNKNKTTTKRKP